MQSEVSRINVFYPKTKEVKSIEIRDEAGNLKYNFLLRLIDEGVVVKDDWAWAALVEIARAYQGASKQIKKGQKPTTSAKSVLEDLRLEQNELH